MFSKKSYQGRDGNGLAALSIGELELSKQVAQFSLCALETHILGIGRCPSRKRAGFRIVTLGQQLNPAIYAQHRQAHRVEMV